MPAPGDNGLAAACVKTTVLQLFDTMKTVLRYSAIYIQDSNRFNKI